MCESTLFLFCVLRVQTLLTHSRNVYEVPVESFNAEPGIMAIKAEITEMEKTFLEAYATQGSASHKTSHVSFQMPHTETKALPVEEEMGQEEAPLVVRR